MVPPLALTTRGRSTTSTRLSAGAGPVGHGHRLEVIDPTLPQPDGAIGALEGALMQFVARTDGGWLSAGTALTAEAETVRIDAAIWTSPDGRTWQRVPHGPGFVAGTASSLEFGASSLAVAGDRVVVVGRTSGPQTTLWISPARP
jgi:hypothetical protein